jgi:hypothetical protein
MSKKAKNIFQITASYSGNTFIIDENHSFMICEVLCKLFNYKVSEIKETRDELKRLLELLLFKFDDNYDTWNEYDENVYAAQRHLNYIKNLMLKMPLYKHVVVLEEMDYSDLFHCLNKHSSMFDRQFDDTTKNINAYEKAEKYIENGGHYDSINRILSDDEKYNEEQSYEFYDSYVLDDVSNSNEEMLHFRPFWYDDDIEVEDYSGAEILNRALRDLIEPYIEFADTLLYLEETYGKFLDQYIHSKGRYVDEYEIATIFEKYEKDRNSRRIIKASCDMKLTCKAVKLGKKSVWCDVYTFDNLSSFLYFDFFRGLRQGYIPKRCEHCGKYFLLTSGRYYDFCERVVKGTNGKTCRDIGAHKKYEDKCKSDPVLLAYNRAYKAHYARLLKKKMTKSEFLTWSTWAVEYRDAALAGKVRIDEYEKKIKE